jgi:hypothetical protein
MKQLNIVYNPNLTNFVPPLLSTTTHTPQEKKLKISFSLSSGAQLGDI